MMQHHPSIILGETSTETIFNCLSIVGPGKPTKNVIKNIVSEVEGFVDNLIEGKDGIRTEFIVKVGLRRLSVTRLYDGSECIKKSYPYTSHGIHEYLKDLCSERLWITLEQFEQHSQMKI